MGKISNVKSFTPLVAFQSGKPGIRWILASIVLILILALVGGLWLWTHNNAVLYAAFALAITVLALITLERFIHLQEELSRLEIRATTTEKIAEDGGK